MKTIITGVQTGISESLEAAMRACPFAGEITEVLSNQSRGITKWGEEWAQLNNIPVTIFSALAPTTPQKRSRKTMPQREASYKRDQEMVKAADALVLVWDGKYKRNAHMLLHAQERGLRIWSWNMFKRVGVYMEGKRVIPINDVQEAEQADRHYVAGYRAALLFTFRSVLDELGYTSLEEKQAAWILEREEAIAILRKVCATYGDNDWPDDLFLGDVITKHLEKYLP